VEKELESWPSKGEIVFKDMDLRYKEGDLKNDLTLSKLNFRVEPGHKVGVVGRTGAGKSTLGAALSRIIELAGGQILIDGKSIAGIPMHILR
jgi:ABC-type multidrug transport system fused ATPase/permease subunit